MSFLITHIKRSSAFERATFFYHASGISREDVPTQLLLLGLFAFLFAWVLASVFSITRMAWRVGWIAFKIVVLAVIVQQGWEHRDWVASKFEEFVLVK